MFPAGSGGFHPAPAALVDGVRGPVPVSGSRRRNADVRYGKPRSAENIVSGERISKAESRRFRRFCNSTRLYINRGRTVKGKLGFSQENPRCSTLLFQFQCNGGIKFN
jgi:hypothetical protein